MAIEDINIRLRMAATGVDQQVANSEQIADNYARANANAQRLAATQARAGGQQARAAAMAGSRTSSEMLDYSTAGGVTGRGGASARDFANQAQGLGGLVRLYATVAANVFALTAAFGALSRAMDTTNMIAGLDTLGAASGRALGTLSKQLAQVSDGAISMREAMQATAMSSSAGMTNQQILRMGEVAKNASLALGVSMPDAMSRLSRGIVKLEPELLDELGIFTKIEPAVQAYALQLGKTVSSLTDFERRQAFANAVLKEGEDKFSAIADEINANPYNKLSASLQNVTQRGLELVNTVLGPIADLLSKSPTVLTGGLLLLISTLVTKALPALTQFRESLDAERKKAQDLVAKKKEDTLAAGQALGELASRNVLRNMEANAESELRVFENKEKKLNELKKQGANYSAQLNNLLKKDLHDVTETEIAEAKRAAKARLEAAKANYIFSLTNEDRQKARAERIAAQAEMGTVLALERTTNAERAYIAARQDGVRTETNRLQLSREFQNLVRAEERMVVQARRSEIIANVAYNTSLIGIRDAFRLMNAEIEAAGNVGNRFTLGLRAAAAGIGTIITSALGAIGTIIQVVTGAIAVIGLFDAALTSNAKESQRFTDAINNADASVKAVTNTIDLYEKKSENSIRSTIALATAFGELSDSMEVSIKRFQKMQDTAGTYDKIIEFIKEGVDILTFRIFNLSKENTFADSLSKQLSAAVDVAEKFGTSGQLESRLKEYLNIENIFDKEALKKAVKNLDNEGRKGLVGIVESFKVGFQQISNTLDGFKENLNKTYKSLQEFTQSLAPTDYFSKLADSFGKLAVSMVEVSNLNPEQQIKAFEELLKSPEKLTLLGDNFIQEFFSITEKFAEQKKLLDDYSTRISKTTREINKYKQEIQDLNEVPLLNTQRMNQGAVAGMAASLLAGPAAPIAAPGAAAIGAGLGVFTGVIEKIFARNNANTLTAELQQKQKQLQQLQIKEREVAANEVFERANELFAQAARESLEKAAEYTSRALNDSATRAANTISSARASILTGPQAVTEQARIARSEQQIKVREAEDALKLLQSQDTLQTAIRENTAQLEINTETLKNTPESKQAVKRLEEGRDIQRASRMITRGSNREDVIAAIGGQERAGVEQLYQKAATQAAVQGTAELLAVRRQEAKVNEERAKSKAIDIKEEIDLALAKVAQEKEILGIINSRRQIMLNILDVERQIVGLTTLKSIEDKASLEADIRKSNQAMEMFEIETRMQIVRNQIANTKGKEQASYIAQLNFLNDSVKPQLQLRHAAEETLAVRKKTADVLNYEIEQLNKRYELEKSNQDVVNAKAEASLEIERARFTSRAELAGFDKSYVAQKVYEFDLQKNQLDTEKSANEIRVKYQQQLEIAGKRIAKLGESDTDNIREINKEQKRLNDLKDNELAKLITDSDKRKEILGITKEQTLEQEKQRKAQDELNRKLELQESALQKLLATTNFSETFQAQLKYNAQLKKIDAQEDIVRTRLVNEFRAQDEALTQQKIRAIREAEQGKSSEVDRITAEQDKLRAGYTSAIAESDARIATAKQLAKDTLDSAVYQAQFNEQMQRSLDLADALKGAFGSLGENLGTVGDKIGDFIVAFTEYGKVQKQNEDTLAEATKKRIKAEELLLAKRDMGDDPTEAQDQLKQIQTEEDKLRKKSAKDDLAYNQKLASNAKAMFKEKTAAHKAFHAIEKTIHAVRIAMAVMQMATDLKTLFTAQTVEAGKTASTTSGVLSRMGAYAAEIYGKTIGQLGPIAGPVVATALIATLYSLLGKGSSSVSTGPTGAQLNEIGTTGQDYVNGQLVAGEGGVLGDPKAVTDSITTGMEILSKTMFEIFDSDQSKINKKLEGVKYNTQEMVKALLGQIDGYAGLRSNSFTAVPGTNTVSDPWWRWGPLVKTTTTVDILGSGIEIAGKLGDFISQTGNTLLRTWQEIQTTSRKTYFGFYKGDPKVSVTPAYGPVEESFTVGFLKALENFKGALVESTRSLAGDAYAASADALLNEFNFQTKLDFKGKTLEEAQGLFQASFSKNINNATKAVLPFLENFRQGSEELGETLFRLTKDSEDLRYSLGLLGISFKETDLEKRLLAEQKFLSVFGSSDKFGESMNYYLENFVDTNTKYQDNLARLTKVFRENGAEIPTTRAAYARLVDSLREQAETNQVARDNLAKLILYSEAYNKTLEQRLEIEKSLDDLNEALSDFENNTTDLQKAVRTIIKDGFEWYDTLKKLGVATQENIAKVMKLNKFQVLQKLDEQIKTLYETRRNEINKTIESLKSAKDVIIELKKSLLQGTESTLTPLEKYGEIFSDYITTLEKARAGDQKALQKFPQLSQSLLSTGKDLYSSSQIYSDLFSKVMSDIDSLDLSLDDQLTDAELQLKELEDQTSFLDKIDVNTKTTAERLQELLESRKGVEAVDPQQRARQLFEAEKLGISRNDPEYFNKGQQSLDAKALILELETKANQNIAAKEAELSAARAKALAAKDKKLVAQDDPSIKQTFARRFLGTRYARATQEEINVQIPDNDPALLAWVKSVNDEIIAERTALLTAADAALADFNKAKTERDKIITAKTQAESATTLEAVLNAKNAAVTAAGEVDKLLAAATTNIAETNRLVTSFQTMLDKYLLEWPIRVAEYYKEKTLAGDNQLKSFDRIERKRLDLDQNIVSTQGFINYLVDEKAPQDFIDWATGIKNSLVADKGLSYEFTTKAAKELELVALSMLKANNASILAKEAKTVAEAEAFAQQAEQASIAAEAARANMYQFLMVGEYYADKALADYKAAEIEARNRLNKLKPITSPVVDTTNNNRDVIASVGADLGVAGSLVTIKPRDTQDDPIEIIIDVSRTFVDPLITLNTTLQELDTIGLDPDILTDFKIDIATGTAIVDGNNLRDNPRTLTRPIDEILDEEDFIELVDLMVGQTSGVIATSIDDLNAATGTVSTTADDLRNEASMLADMAFNLEEAASLANSAVSESNNSLASNIASLATMTVLSEANKALTVSNMLGLQTVSSLISTGTELVLSSINAVEGFFNSFSSSMLFNEKGEDYSTNSWWNEFSDWDSGLSGRARGGPVTANTPYLVGEVGPELFVPSTNGTIVPNNELSFNNQEIVAKLDQLIQTVAKGAVLNVQATKENTDCIEQAIVSNTNMVRTQSRVGIK